VFKVRTDQIYRTPRLALNVSLVRFVPDDPAFCVVRRFAFSDRVPDLGLCLARRISHRGVHAKRSHSAG
jgi:hypothetical protein